MGGAQVGPDQVDHPIHAGSTQIRHVSSRLAKREFHEPRRDLVNIDGLKAKPRGDRHKRELGQSTGHDQEQVVELRRAQRCPRQPGLGDHPLRVLLVSEVREREPTEPDHRDAVGADHRDENDM